MVKIRKKLKHVLLLTDKWHLTKYKRPDIQLVIAPSTAQNELLWELSDFCVRFNIDAGYLQIQHPQTTAFTKCLESKAK